MVDAINMPQLVELDVQHNRYTLVANINKMELADRFHGHLFWSVFLSCYCIDLAISKSIFLLEKFIKI